MDKKVLYLASLGIAKSGERRGKFNPLEGDLEVTRRILKLKVKGGATVESGGIKEIMSEEGGVRNQGFKVAKSEE